MPGGVVWITPKYSEVLRRAQARIKNNGLLNPELNLRENKIELGIRTRLAQTFTPDGAIILR